VRLGDCWPFRLRTKEVRPEQGRDSGIELRIGDATFSAVRRHVEDTAHGEEAAFLFCGYSRTAERDILLAREWLPIPQSAKVLHGEGYGLEWSAEFSSSVLAKADRTAATVVLVHSHGHSTRPTLSAPDRNSASRLFPGFSRILSGRPSGSIVLGAHAAGGEFWCDGRHYGQLTTLRVVGAPIDVWRSEPHQPSKLVAKRRHERMIQATGPESEAKLGAASIAVIGLCGGGSHVCQQLAHIGIGRIVPIDDDVVEDVNLGRMVGSIPSDVNKRLKTEVMRRLIHAIDPGIEVDVVPYRFPAAQTLGALLSVDLVIACVDSFAIREQINAFCRRHHLPLIDIGLAIKSEDGKLVAAHGQLAVVTPDAACLRCGPLLSDAVLAKERTERPPGYDNSPHATGAPQVISMNGVLASEAANSALDFVTGYSRGKRGAGWWLYDGRAGSMTPCDQIARRSSCPACAEQGLGDP